MKKFLLIPLLALISINSYAVRLDGCNPSAPENQNVKGSEWKARCLNGKVSAVWLSEYDDMTLAQAKKTSSKNGAWKLFSQNEYMKQKK